MAEVVRYVDPDATGAGDGTSWTDAYTSLSAWDIAEGTDLVTDGDWHHVYVRASSGTLDSTYVTISSGWTTGASNYILIEAASSDYAVKTGIDTSRYRLKGTSNNSLYIAVDYCRIKGLQILGPESNFAAIRITGQSASNDIRIIDCYLDDPNENSGYGITADDSNVNLTVENTIADGWNRGFTVTGTTTFYNCVSRGRDGSDTYGGFRDTGGTTECVNCASFNNASGYDFRDIDTVTNCASDDETGTNAVGPSGSVWDNEFNDPANGDYTLLNTGNLYDAGVGPGTDSDVPSTDIDGDSRSGSTCDIGVDEYVGGVPVTVAPIGVLIGPLGGPLAGVF